MSSALRRAAPILATVTAALVWSCGPKHIPTVDHQGEDLVVLLADADSGATGRATVSSAATSAGRAGAIDLGAARESTTVVAGQPPAPATVMSDADVQRIFGDALSALPPAPARFTLFYKFDSDELTDESRALVPGVLQAVKERPFPDVVVIGHTDTTGTSASNFSLGMKRALAVRSLLEEAGLDPSYVQAISHGKTDLLVPTADNVAEPRNRRVEISVR